MPGGNPSVTTSLRACTPAFPQMRQLWLTICPAPPQASQPLVNTMWPRAQRVEPAPAHCGHASGGRGTCPVPAQDPHRSERVTDSGN